MLEVYVAVAKAGSTGICWYNFDPCKRYVHAMDDKKSFFFCKRPMLAGVRNRSLPGKLFFLIFQSGLIILGHEWYEESEMLMWNNRTFLKSWETMNETEVSLVC